MNAESKEHRLEFGMNTGWNLHAPQATVRRCGLEPIANLQDAVDQAFSAPLGFPSVDQAIVPGDQVVVAVDSCLPNLPAMVQHVITWLVQHGCQPNNLQVVLDSQGALDSEELRQARADQLTQLLRKATGALVSVEYHDPDDETKLAYVAANEDSDPIYLNRTIIDADVVIPISCARGWNGLDYFGVFSLFPGFSDRKTQVEFYSLTRLARSGEYQRLQSWADQAGWWAGWMFVVQVVPAGGETIAGIWAGAPEEVERAAQGQMVRGWECDLPTTDMVIALLPGVDSQQSWWNLARSLYTAHQRTGSNGKIVVCTQISQKPGQGLKKLRQTHRGPEEIAASLERTSASDALPAAVILNATRDSHVYLASELPDDQVESLGMGVLGTQEQLQTLVDQQASCLILESAQHQFAQTINVAGDATQRQRPVFLPSPDNSLAAGR